MRIAYLITDLDVGGAERNLAMLVRGLDSRCFDVSVASLMPVGAVGEDVRAAGAAVTDLHMAGRSDCRVMGRLLGWLRSVRPDILHTWLLHANVLGRLAARLARVPVVVSSIRVAEPRRLHLLLERLTSPLADCILTNSESLRDYMTEQGLEGRRIRVIPNSVDLQRFSALEGRRGEGTGMKVLFVGRLAEQKGVDVLLRSAAMLHPRCDVTFELVGEGPDRTRLEHLARELRLENVRFPGPRDDVPDLLCEADILVLPSRWEGLPNVVLEAMAAGCPVVATDVVGTRDLIRDGVNGLLVPPDDPAALAAAIGRLATDAALRKSLATAGMETARTYSIAAMTTAHARLYAELLRGRSVRR